MSELFDCSIDNISLHIKNIFKENELTKKAAVEEYSITAKDGKKYKTKHYNLDVIISVGYRVKSHRGIQFRKWATKVLQSHLLKGYTINRNYIGDNKQLQTLLSEMVIEIKHSIQKNMSKSTGDIENLKNRMQNIESMFSRLKDVMDT
jgi:hypothetical protein